MKKCFVKGRLVHVYHLFNSTWNAVNIMVYQLIEAE